MGVRRLTFDLDLERARAVLRGVDPALEPRAVSRLHGGSTEVYRIDLAAGAPLVLKLYPDAPPWGPAKEPLVAGWIGEAAGIAIPRWIALDESRAALPLRYALISWLPGEAMRGLMDHPGAADAFRQMGALLRRFHAIAMPAFGYVLGDGIETPQADNATYMAGAFERAFRGFRGAGGDDDLARRLEAVVAARAAIFAHCPGPALCHDDFQPGNVLAEAGADGRIRLTGLLDFGNCRAGDPLMDLAKAIFSCGHECPASVAPLREGYGPVDHPDLEGALWLYTLYHRVAMWTWLTGLGDKPDALSRDLAEMAR
jgi:aminoglycoside phosphotransferase (APT) family kinase protein